MLSISTPKLNPKRLTFSFVTTNMPKWKDKDHLNFDPIARTGSLDGSYDKSYDIGGKGLSQHAGLHGDEGDEKGVRRAGATHLNGKRIGGRKSNCTIQ